MQENEDRSWQTMAGLVACPGGPRAVAQFAQVKLVLPIYWVEMVYIMHNILILFKSFTDCALMFCRSICYVFNIHFVSFILLREG